MGGLDGMGGVSGVEMFDGSSSGIGSPCASSLGSLYEVGTYEEEEGGGVGVWGSDVLRVVMGGWIVSLVWIGWLAGLGIIGVLDGGWLESSRTGMGMRRFFLCICYTPFTTILCL